MLQVRLEKVIMRYCVINHPNNSRAIVQKTCFTSCTTNTLAANPPDKMIIDDASLKSNQSLAFLKDSSNIKSKIEKQTKQF